MSNPGPSSASTINIEDVTGAVLTAAQIANPPSYLLANPNAIYTDQSGNKYSVNAAQTALVAFAGGGSGASIYASSGGSALVSGDQLVGNVASTGTPGSGSAVVGFAVLDSNGNFVGNWIPRTGTLTSLEALAGTQGELASATDIPAIVQFTGTAGGAYTFLPFDTVQSGTFSGSGAISGTIPCTSQTVRVTLSGAQTSFTGTLQNGYLDGQTLTVQFISTPSALTSITVNGSVIATNSGPTRSRTTYRPPQSLARYSSGRLRARVGCFLISQRCARRPTRPRA